jgi:hypothetical protein
MAHSWHTQSELDAFLAHERSPCLFGLALCDAKKLVQTVVGRIHFRSLNDLGDFRREVLDPVHLPFRRVRWRIA